ncbi:MAG: FCD domain-containing protein [Alphaproteobacteria bacterium]|nr:MAG: FCD domain-containing protein [Alphaproteobacteria bacterium]
MIAQSTQDHTRIVEAICAGDPDRAADAMKLHLAHIEACTRRLWAFNVSRRINPTCSP